MDMLLNAGADIDATDKKGMTPLLYALDALRTEAALFLISKGANTDLADNDGHKAIDYATAHGLREIVSMLGHTADSDSQGNMPLHQAVFNNQSEVVRTLLAGSKQYVNAVNDSGETPLLIACSNGNLLITGLLIDAGADVNKALLDGNTPLHFSAYQGNSFIGKALLQANAKIDAQSEDGKTPLIVAAGQGNNDFVSLLIEQNANVNLADNQQFTALHYASANGFTEIVETLLMAGAEG